MKNRIVSDSMYTDNDHYLKFCILRSIVLAIQNVCRLDFLQVPRGRCGKTLLHHQKRLLSFQNEHLFVFIDKQSTQYHKKHLVWWMKRSGHSDYASGDVAKTGDKPSLHCEIWNWLIKVFRCKLVYTQMLFDSQLQFVTRGIQHITERESKNTF